MLPSIDELLSRPSLTSHPRSLALAAARKAVAEVRSRVLRGEDVQFDDGHLQRALTAVSEPKLKQVINASGVVLHTNLGRAPLAPEAIARIANVAGGYCNLEFDLANGERGTRYAPVVELLCALTGAEDALVVNNCAAAVLLTLSALGQGREVIVSRGELVEIGGGFRVPDVMRQSGATMIEVGTTNRTRVKDYESAISDRTALLVKVHQSNFAQVGFTESTSTRELSALGRDRHVPLYEDLGSGALTPLNGEGLGSEPTVASVIHAGADLVSFSGDKLLGGPQAGIVVGKRALIDTLRTHPLNRALRIDKLTVAALEATLELYRDGREDVAVPARMAMVMSAAATKTKAEQLSSALGLLPHRLVQTTSRVGGGSLPLAAPPGWAVALMQVDAEDVSRKLRAGVPPVVGRIVDGEVWLDVRCVAETELETLAEAARVACQRENHRW